MRAILSTYIQERRMEAAKPYLKGDILDLGCGYGHLIPYLVPDQDYTGVDKNINIINLMRERYSNKEFICCDLEKESLASNHLFDTIVLLAIIEHLSEPKPFFSTLRKNLKPAGRIVFTTPTPLGHFVHRKGSILGLFYAEAAKDHKTVFNRDRLNHILKDQGFRIIIYHTFLWGNNQLCVAISE